jgi:hypothetical protein
MKAGTAASEIDGEIFHSGKVILHQRAVMYLNQIATEAARK